DFDAVRKAVMSVARYDALKVAEAMLSGERPRLARMLEGLRGEGEAPPRVLWILAEEIRAICRVQSGITAGRPLAEVLREARVWGEARQSLVGGAANRGACRRDVRGPQRPGDLRVRERAAALARVVALPVHEARIKAVAERRGTVAQLGHPAPELRAHRLRSSNAASRREGGYCLRAVQRLLGSRPRAPGPRSDD